MKCGLIWARSARSSASIVRVRCRAEVGQLDLGGDPPGDLLGRPGQARRGGRPVGREGADHAVVGDDRGQRRRCGSGSPGRRRPRRAASSTTVRPVASTSRACRRACVPVVGARAVPGRAWTLVSHSAIAARAQQRAQVRGPRSTRPRGSGRRAGGARPARRCAGCRRSRRSTGDPRSRRRRSATVRPRRRPTSGQRR